MAFNVKNPYPNDVKFLTAVACSVVGAVALVVIRVLAPR